MLKKSGITGLLLVFCLCGTLVASEIVQWTKIDGQWTKSVVDTDSDATAIAGDVPNHLFATGPSGTYYYYREGLQWMKMPVNDQHYRSIDTYRLYAAMATAIRSDGKNDRIAFVNNTWQTLTRPSGFSDYVQAAACRAMDFGTLCLRNNGRLNYMWADGGTDFVPANDEVAPYKVIYSVEHADAGSGGVHYFASSPGNTDYSWLGGWMDVSNKEYADFAWNDENIETSAYGLAAEARNEIDYLWFDGAAFHTTSVTAGGEDITDIASWSTTCIATDSTGAYAQYQSIADANVVWTSEFFTLEPYRQLTTSTYSGEPDGIELFALTYEPNTFTKAWNPRPNPNDPAGALANVVLEWNAGIGAVSHDVYFGSDAAAVAAADNASVEFMGNYPGTSYAVSGLIPGSVYYWRVDEIGADSSAVTGDVWPLIVSGREIIDNFETYSDPNVLQEIWEVVGDASISLESTIALDRHSMQIDYDHTGESHTTEVMLVPAQSDWTVKNAMSFSLYFRGLLTNEQESLSVVLESGNGSGVQNFVYNGNPASVSGTTWTEWAIDYKDITVDLNNITKLTVVIGNGTGTAAGTLYIDNIALYACRPGGLMTDLNGDCVVDLSDFAVMAAEWLEVRGF